MDTSSDLPSHSQDSLDAEKLRKSLLQIQNIDNFKTEDDVREDFLRLLLDGLGYSNDKNSSHRIERGSTFQITDLVIGTKKKPFEGYRPDYILNINGKRRWLIDAKNPKESVTDQKHIKQAFSYSINREINVPFFVLCNGAEMAVYRTSDQSFMPLTTFLRAELVGRMQELFEMFSTSAFILREKFSEIDTKASSRQTSSTVILEKSSFEPINYVIQPRKQASPIHFGPHPYFTKRAWNVVKKYVEHFSKEGELIGDPFGGTGTVCIEAALIRRRCIHYDLNPIANFIANSLSTLTNLDLLDTSFRQVQENLERYINASTHLSGPEFWFPLNVPLPKDADVQFVHEYFSTTQLIQLSALRAFILEVNTKSVREALLFVFSSTLVKCNKGYHNTPRTHGIPGGGDSGLMKYYRYMIPRRPFAEQSVLSVFEAKYKSFFKAQLYLRSMDFSEREKEKLISVDRKSATEMEEIADESIDYIFTDPPYGSKIAYLDCSTMFNAWLNFEVEKRDFESEVIAGGSLGKSQAEYIRLLQCSLTNIHRVLKPNRWFSIVFASSDPAHWHAVHDFATNLGFEHANTVCQPSPRKTVKKNQNPLTVFSGEMILNFKKRISGRAVVKKSYSETDPNRFILDVIERVIVENRGAATIEAIMHSLIPSLLDSGLLNTVSEKPDDFNQLLKTNFEQTENGSWRIKSTTKIGCHIPIEKRIEYYLISCLNRAEKEGRKIGIDEIVMEVIPFLRNGMTPSNQDIISELKRIATSTDAMTWALIKTGPRLLFPE